MAVSCGANIVYADMFFVSVYWAVLGGIWSRKARGALGFFCQIAYEETLEDDEAVMPFIAASLQRCLLACEVVIFPR